MDPAEPRYLRVPRARGHYESFYLKAGDAASRRAVWLRYTVHKRPGAAPVASLWATLFDDAGPHAAKVTDPTEALAPAAGARGGAAAGDWVAIGDAAIGARGAHGAVPGLAEWQLRFDGGEEPFLYLPSEILYVSPLPRTKALSLLPAVRVTGRVTVRGRAVELDGWPGMVGHNWGAEHAERWIWLHGTAFDQQPDAWIDMIFGRVRVGRWTSPWIANGCLSLDGRRHRLGSFGRMRTTMVDERPERATFWVAGDDVALRGEVSSPRRDVVGWVYRDPAGPEHHTAHGAIADLRLRVARRDGPPLELTVAGGATYELGMREHDHGIAIEPFDDP